MSTESIRARGLAVLAALEEQLQFQRLKAPWLAISRAVEQLPDIQSLRWRAIKRAFDAALSKAFADVRFGGPGAASRDDKKTPDHRNHSVST